jgi:hypothetical protein
MARRKILEEVVYDSSTGEYAVESSHTSYLTFNAFKNFFLENEVLESGGGRFIIRVYGIPEVEPGTTDEELAEIQLDTWMSVREFSPVVCYSTSDSKFVAVRIEDDHGTPRPWMEFNTISVGMEAKVMKRLAMLGTKSYLNGKLEVVFVEDDEYYAHVPGVLFVRILETPEDMEPYVDGSFQARNDLREDLLDLSAVEDAEKAHYIYVTHMEETDAANARIILPEHGTLKGDAEFCELLNADIVAYDCNLFSSITTKDGSGLLQFTPQEQLGSVRTNRQSIAHFWDLLFAVDTPNRKDTQGLVRDAFRDEIDDNIETFRAGDPLSFVAPAARDEEDAIQSVQTKIMKWHRSGHSLNESLYLLMAMATQRLDMWTPRNGDNVEKKRTRLPVPFALRVSLRNETSYNMVRGEHPKLSPGECFIDPTLGIIVSDYDWHPVIDSLGGADKDDHVEVHFRRVTGDHTFLDIEFRDGDIAMFLIRNPIGLACDWDGDPDTYDEARVGSEYYILKPNSAFAANIKLYFGKDLPEIYLAARPTHILELDLPQGLQPRKPDQPDTYTKSYFHEQIKAASRSQMVYDIHSATMRKFKLLGIKFEFLAKEEFFIDVCAQWRNPSDIRRIVESNEEYGKMLPDPPEPTVLDEIAHFHAQQVLRFSNAVKVHIKEIKRDLEDLYQDFESESEPILIQRFRAADAFYRQQNNRNGALYHRDWEAIGNMVVRRLDEIQDRDQTANDFIEAYDWVFTQVKFTTRSNPTVTEMYYDTDQKLMAGKMLDRLIESLD